MSLRQHFVEALRGVERGAWVRFFIAIFGLALAFASALLSTASREAGDVLATAIFASLALLLAGVVAVTTVPYLARRVVARRVRDALNYEVTREGLVYLILTLLIGVAALNTGNNLLFIVVAAMLGAVLVSGIVSAVMINGLDIRCISRTMFLPARVMPERCCSTTAACFLRFPSPWCRRSESGRPAGAGNAPNSSILPRARDANRSSDGLIFPSRESIRRPIRRPSLSRASISHISPADIVRAPNWISAFRGADCTRSAASGSPLAFRFPSS